MNPLPSNPRALAEAGEKIYNEQYRAKFEAELDGKFVAINIKTGKATVADDPEGALEQAKREDPSGLFHLIKIGSAGAFRVSYTRHETNAREIMTAVESFMRELASDLPE